MRNLVLLAILICHIAAAPSSGAAPLINVVIDTDVASTFDDSAAIAFALQNPTLNVVYILTATGDTTARAQVVAKYLTMVNRTDIPIGIGLPTTKPTNPTMYGWAADFDLSTYPGGVYTDGIGGLIDVVQALNEPVAIIAIAPATNFPELLMRYPDIVKTARIYAMSGSIYRGYDNSTTPDAEYNVWYCPNCSMLMYGAGWPVTTTPLDTCGTVRLTGDSYTTLLTGNSVVGSTLIECFVYYASHGGQVNLTQGTDIWYDTMAVYLALPSDPSLLEYQAMNISITDDGFTIPSPKGYPITVALLWTDGGEAAFEQQLATAIATKA